MVVVVVCFWVVLGLILLMVVGWLVDVSGILFCCCVWENVCWMWFLVFVMVIGFVVLFVGIFFGDMVFVMICLMGGLLLVIRLGKLSVIVLLLVKLMSMVEMRSVVKVGLEFDVCEFCFCWFRWVLCDKCVFGCVRIFGIFRVVLFC